MTPFTHTDRQAGREAMEKALSPMQRAYRKFLSGRPPAAPKNTPLGAVTAATDQRARLTRILENELGPDAARITSMAVIVRVPGGEHMEHKAASILVREGKEGEAISMLTALAEIRPFLVVGVLFVVLSGNEKRSFAFPIERTPEGQAALLWTCERQHSDELRKKQDN